MRSFKSRLMNLLLRMLGAKKMFAEFHQAKGSPKEFKAAVDKARSRNQNRSEPTEAFKQKYPYEGVDISGSKLHLHQIGSQKKVILFLHGGAYVLGLSAAYWDFMEKVGLGADCNVALFDYPLAPEYKCETAIEKTVQAYEYLTSQYAAKDIILMGDSAGGGLAMALSLYLRDLGKPQPNKTILLYPWLDVTMSHPEAKGVEPNDLLLSVDGLIACGEHYAGSLGVEHPMVSPWFGTLEALPPVHIFTGSWDILHPEGRDFSEKLKAAGSEAHLYTYPEMQHAWLLFDMPESRAGLEQIFAAIKGEIIIS